MPLKRAFVGLQDRYVNSLAVACCPTMDLVAVITLDRHLLVHRTTSWQKLLHIKPSDIGLEMATVVWRPDGLQLAVGCDEGDVALIEIESGEVLPERRCSFRHEHPITAMHWAAISESEGGGSVAKKRQKFGDDWTGQRPMSQAKLQFQKRASRFLPGYGDPTAAGDTVLVTADMEGRVALWWMGRVLLTHFDVRKYFSDEDTMVLELLEQQENGASGFQIERVDIAPDLSLLFVLVSFYVCEKSVAETNQTPDRRQTKVHRMLTLNMTRVQCMHEEVMLVADTVDHVDTIVNRIIATGRKMTAEWKNATRIFELKMGLIGSLYEKYACDDPPQADMLSVVVTGITAPALAQYFAQDIQEMSVHRMQKALFSGCDILGTLVDETMKRDLVDLLFLLSELRGSAKWSLEEYTNKLGITVTALDNLAEVAQDTLVAMEMFTLALYETRQDFAQLFQWILERIRVHTNSTRPGEAGREGQNGNNMRESGAAAQGSKSLLNLRRLCDFLACAAEAARRFQKQQPSCSKYKVETTFGNAISHQLSARPILTGKGTTASAVGCITLSDRIQNQWNALRQSMIANFASTIVRENSGCFTVGNTVQECHIRFRRPFSTRKRNDSITDEHHDDDSGSDEDEEEGVDWSSLKHFGLMQDEHDYFCTTLMGFRLESGALLLVRVLRDVCPTRYSKTSAHFSWDAAVVEFSQGASGKQIYLSGFDFYGDVPSEKSEQLALVLQRTLDNQTRQEWLYLQAYDQVEFSRIATPSAISGTHENSLSPFEAILAHGPTHTFRIDRARGRVVASVSASQKASASTNNASVIAIASRGTLCVTLPPSRLAVFDAEDSEDDDADEDKEEVHE